LSAASRQARNATDEDDDNKVDKDDEGKDEEDDSNTSEYVHNMFAEVARKVGKACDIHVT
jgi:hypothetical protein